MCMRLLRACFSSPFLAFSLLGFGGSDDTASGAHSPVMRNRLRNRLWLAWMTGEGGRVRRTGEHAGTRPNHAQIYCFPAREGPAGSGQPTRPGFGGVQAGVQVQAELLWGWRVARRPSRAPAWPRTSPSPSNWAPELLSSLSARARRDLCVPIQLNFKFI